MNDNYDVHKYVRVVYQILMFIDENCPSDKRKYSRIFRSFISNDLNLILAMNCAQLDSNEQIVFIKYKYLIEKYHLLEHLIILDLAENTKLFSSPKLTNLLVIAGIFTPSAFGDGENIRKALESAFEDYHLSLSTQLYQISNNIKCHKKNNRFYNENLEKLSDLLEEHEKLSKGASKELVDLNRKCLNLIKHAVGLTENKKIPENFRKTLSDIEISFKNIISDGCKQLENVSFYDHYQLELEISKFESTNPLNQFLDGIMHAVSEELKSVEFEIDNTIKNTSSRV
nr:putative phage abortive infection protein [Vibrio scophthalmi]